MKIAYSLVLGVLSFAIASDALANSIPLLTPQSAQSPQVATDVNNAINGANANIPGLALSWTPGSETAIVTTKGGFTKLIRPTIFQSLEGSASTFTCTTNPTITLFNCGTSTTCASPVTIGTVTVTAAGTVVDGAITAANAAVSGGNYVAWATSAGACTVLDITGTAVGQ